MNNTAAFRSDKPFCSAHVLLSITFGSINLTASTTRTNQNRTWCDPFSVQGTHLGEPRGVMSLAA
jgi:hypothetical protein